MKRVLITGANGFIGKALVLQLRKGNQYEIITLVRSSAKAEHEEIIVDLSDREKVKSIIQEKQPDVIYHLASEKNRNSNRLDSLDHLFIDFQNSKNLIEASLGLMNLERFVFLGSCEEYGLGEAPFLEFKKEYPISNYSFSKTATTNLLIYLYHTFQFPMTVLRPSLVYGPGQGSEMFLPSLIQSLLLKQTFPMSQGEQSRDYLFVDDLIDGLSQVLDFEETIGKVINLGSSVTYKVKDVALKVADLIDSNAKNLLLIGALPNRKNEIMDYRVDIRLAKKLLGWEPKHKFADGLSKTIVHFKKLVLNA